MWTQVHKSFDTQISRLLDAGYPKTLLVAICEKICQNLKRGQEGIEGKTKKKTGNPIVVVPYLHGITHRLKKIAGRQGVQVVCSAPNKAYSMCGRVYENQRSNQAACNIAHKTKYALCQKEVVYNIPLTCGKCYIGQTGRCINDRTREHATSLRNLTAAGHLAAHCRACQCEAQLRNVNIVGQHKNQLAREMLEALAIEEKGEQCVSAPSVALHNTEKMFLRSSEHWWKKQRGRSLKEDTRSGHRYHNRRGRSLKQDTRSGHWSEKRRGRSCKETEQEKWEATLFRQQDWKCVKGKGEEIR